jgi:hypothetical protein
MKQLTQRSKRDTLAVESAKLKHLLLSQFGAPILHSSMRAGDLTCDVAFSRRATALANHITHVIDGCAKEEMFGVDAESNVACMADEQAGGYGPEVQFIGKTVGSGSSSVTFDTPIPLDGFAALPNPTFLGVIGNDHIRPKPRFRRDANVESKLYNIHGTASYQVVHDPGWLQPRPDFLMPNYITTGAVVPTDHTGDEQK